MCLSPAIDVTYHVEALTLGGTNRVRTVTHHPGGKAVNVARILHGLGDDVRLLAPVGGNTGAEFTAALAGLGVATDLVPTAAATRRTVAVVDEQAGTSTMLVEPAEIDCWPRLVARVESVVMQADAVVVSGAVPNGAPADAMSSLIRLANRHELPIIIDTSGPALVDALTTSPTMIKPNADELAAVSSGTDPASAAAAVARSYGTTVVASLGADGVVAVDQHTAWQAGPARPLSGNPTGAGDALVAGLARGLTAGTPLSAMLPECVALSAAAVLNPVAGCVDRDDYLAQLAGVTVRELASNR